MTKHALLLFGMCAALQACDSQVAPLSQTPEAGVANGFTAIAAGTTNLNAISGVSDSALWVVGDKGTIGHWNGSSLVFEKSGTQANLRGVFAVTADQAYAVGDGGTFLERTATGWKQVAQGITREVLTAVWADTTRVVAVGSFGVIVLGTGITYQNISNSSYQENLFGVTGTSGGPITAVGALGLVLSITETSVSRVTIPNFTKLLVGVATGPSATYIVGQEGTVFVADASGINPVNGCPVSALRSVALTGPDAWVVGWDGTICKVAGTTTTSFPYSDSRWFNGIYAASPTSLWVVGASGTFVHGLPLSPRGDE
jgi:photosystem II stability/assembly factor-like uncharacterized protein